MVGGALPIRPHCFSAPPPPFRSCLEFDLASGLPWTPLASFDFDCCDMDPQLDSCDGLLLSLAFFSSS